MVASNLKTCNSRNWENITDVNKLKEIQFKPLGWRHQPVNHGEIVETFGNVFNNRNMKIDQQYGYLSPDKLKYIYIAQTTMKTSTQDYTYCFGFVNFNNLQKSFQMMCGEQVFVCSNMMISGILNYTKKKHIGNVSDEIEGKIDLGFTEFEKFVEKREKQISSLQSREINEDVFGKVILDFHRQSTLGSADISRVVKEFDNPSYEEFKPRTAWSLQNSVTHVLKEVTNPYQRITVNNEMQNIFKRNNLIESTLDKELIG